MAETNNAPWLMVAPIEMTVECVGTARFTVSRAADDNEYLGPAVSAVSLREGRHRHERPALRMEIPAQPTWRTPDRVLASV
ncbi:hypothetical protein F4553_003234 [Allocatelliglobosispora scoriae]|uniref:Uncharacterized protein n=1 Tax=Allocatelliglobosispora scoriae TaxID=643052 RepID=A0A841BQ82_9ACTN|nr:hypothetical protein [Allocatelliglobosispora scoriae]MBB5869855.1 hypothetical protein [Allocatelliglobosispora scoriae]